MKKFKFSLEMVLNYKQQVLEALQGEHAAALSRLREQEQLLERMWQEYREYNEEYCEKKAAGMTISEALSYQSGLRVLESRIQKETEQLERFRKDEERKRERVVEARKETASIEKLREKKLGAYQKAVAKSEELFIEEFVSSRNHFA
mgnify:FL=1